MAFSQATMTGEPSLRASGLDLLVSWVSTSPPGTLFQLYLNAKLAWHGTDRSVLLPYPSGRTRIDVGTVAAGEGAVDFSASLPTTYPPDRVNLTWTGGGVRGGRPRGVPNLRTARGRRRGQLRLAAGGHTGHGGGRRPQRVRPRGLRPGRVRDGGAELLLDLRPAARRLLDVRGRALRRRGEPERQPRARQRDGRRAPRPPAADSSGRRLTYSYNPSTRVPTLNWLASPG